MNFFRPKPQGLQIVERLLESGGNQERSMGRKLACVELEGGGDDESGRVIAGHHRQFVEIG
jgi:hypothetical protein